MTDPSIINRLYGRSKGKPLRAHQQHLVDTLLPQIAVPAPPASQAAGARRANDLLGSDKAQGEIEIPSRVDVDASETASAFELLRQKDFEQMSLAEATEARRVLSARLWSLPERKSRRMTPSVHGGQPDLRRTMRKALAKGNYHRCACFLGQFTG